MPQLLMTGLVRMDRSAIAYRITTILLFHKQLIEPALVGLIDVRPVLRNSDILHTESRQVLAPMSLDPDQESSDGEAFRAISPNAPKERKNIEILIKVFNQYSV